MINKRFVSTGKKVLNINVANIEQETGNGKIYINHYRGTKLLYFRSTND